jgi:integrase
VDGERLIQDIARSEHRLSWTTLKHIKSFLSGVFTYARRQGVLTNANPMQGVSIPRGAEPQDTLAYSLEQITTMLGVLSGRRGSSSPPQASLVSDARRSAGSVGRLRARIGRLVRRDSRGAFRVGHARPAYEDAPKQGISPRHPGSGEDPRGVPEGERESAGGFIFEGAFAKCHIESILAAHGQRWHWWPPFRRGLATNLHGLGVDDKIIQTIPRHSSVQTTREIYIKGFEGDAVAAMKRLASAIQSRPN